MSELEMVERFLRSQSTLTLATTAPDGSPHAAALFYLLHENLRLYWFSSASSGHSRNLERDAAAVSVHRHTDEWRKIRGVQMRGTAAKVKGRAARRAIAGLYMKRFRLGRLWEAGIARSTLYCFQPDWVRYIDNSKGFGYKFELALPVTREDRNGSA
jgi:uncharacterized protein YhbP (UPF0306 family)